MAWKCPKCGFIPRDQPPSGAHFCQKCGKRSIIPGGSTSKAKGAWNVKKKYWEQQQTPSFTTTFRKQHRPTDPDIAKYETPIDHLVKPKQREKLRVFYKK